MTDTRRRETTDRTPRASAVPGSDDVERAVDADRSPAAVPSPQELASLRRAAYSRDAESAPLVDFTDPATGERVRIRQPLAALRAAEAAVARATTPRASAGYSDSVPRLSPTTLAGLESSGADSADPTDPTEPATDPTSDPADPAGAPERRASPWEAIRRFAGVRHAIVPPLLVALVAAFAGYAGASLAPPKAPEPGAGALAVFDRPIGEADTLELLPSGVGVEYEARLLTERNGWTLHAVRGASPGGRDVVCLVTTRMGNLFEECAPLPDFQSDGLEFSTVFTEFDGDHEIQARWFPNGTLYFESAFSASMVVEG